MQNKIKCQNKAKKSVVNYKMNGMMATFGWWSHQHKVPMCILIPYVCSLLTITSIRIPFNIALFKSFQLVENLVSLEKNVVLYGTKILQIGIISYHCVFNTHLLCVKSVPLLYLCCLPDMPTQYLGVICGLHQFDLLQVLINFYKFSVVATFPLLSLYIRDASFLSTIQFLYKLWTCIYLY